MSRRDSEFITSKRACGSPEYRAWINLKTRCNNPNTPYWHLYGGRGITVCERWDKSFADFIADIGVRPGPGYSVERINVHRGYEPDNCVWATRKEQARNTRRNHLIMFRGKLSPLVEVAEALGIKPNTLCWRLKRGWSLEKALG